jgi:putative endonuclease
MGIVARGFRFKGGEIDLIARDGEELVFVEVKTRTSEEFGSPAESVTRAKRRKLLQAASFYLQSHGILQHPCRFDVISVRLGSDGCSNVEHLQDAFRPGD